MKPTPSLAVAFATIERPQVVQRLVLSVRKHFPDLPIYVADQSRHVDAILPFYEANKVTLLRMPYDIGVTASRNRLAREVKEDYLILCDDDFVFGPETSFAEAISILEADPDLAVVGGRLFDLYEDEEFVRNWEIFLQYDPKQKILFSIPIYDLAPKVREVGGVRYYLCDAVLNFAVFRRSVFSAGVQWDERFKSNGEHEDFYLNLKLNTQFKVAHLPTMVARHHHPEIYLVYRGRLRERNEGWKLFLEKWGLDQHIEYGLGVRTIDDVDVVTAEAEARSRFFINPELSISRPRATRGGLLIGDRSKIVTVGALDENGGDLAGSPRLGSVLVNPRTARIVEVPVGDDRQRHAPRQRSEADLVETYQLESVLGGQPVSSAEEQLYFRYDPILHKDAEFFLWYMSKAPAGPESGGWRRLCVVARWAAADGTHLVWRSRRMFLDLRPAPYWLPLYLEPPVFPNGCEWIRFDLVTDGGRGIDPVCTGFLFRSPGARQQVGSDVLALGRLPNDGTSPGQPGQLLEDVGRGCRAWPVSPTDGVHDHLSMLDMEMLSGLEALYFVGWDSLGRALVSARLPVGDVPMPGSLALPKAGWIAPRARLYGYGRETGFVTLSWPGLG